MKIKGYKIISIEINNYTSNGNTAISLICLDDNVPSPFATITVNFDKKLEKDMARYMSLSEEIEEDAGGNVVIQGTIYPGCRIIISNVMYFVKSEVSHSKFVREGADIRITAI